MSTMNEPYKTYLTTYMYNPPTWTWEAFENFTQ